MPSCNKGNVIHTRTGHTSSSHPTGRRRKHEKAPQSARNGQEPRSVSYRQLAVRGLAAMLLGRPYRGTAKPCTRVRFRNTIWTGLYVRPAYTCTMTSRAGRSKSSASGKPKAKPRACNTPKNNMAGEIGTTVHNNRNARSLLGRGAPIHAGAPRARAEGPITRREWRNPLSSRS